MHYPLLSEKKVKGTALLNISALTHKKSFIGNSWNYTGTIIHFTPKDSSLAEETYIPTIVYLADQAGINRPLANCSYCLEGHLKKSNNKYIFYPEKNAPWYPLSDSWSFAEWRFKAKQAVKNYIQQKIHSEPSRSFLAGITTGDFENRLLSFEFSRFGLQHIMAISGFHFAIVATILSFILSLIIERRAVLIILMTLMTLYFLFLGNAPSIIRAWISCLITFAALLLEKVPSGLNSLGIGLLAVLILEPEMVHHLGFQFSFIVTAAILLFYSPIDHYLQFIFSKKTLSVVIEMNTLNQYGFIILALFRQALALSIAVNLAALPITLYYFQKFPLMGLIYNFFFPWMVSLSMLLLIVGFSLDLINFHLGNAIHRLNEIFTQFVLDYTYALPRSLDLYVQMNLHQNIVIIFLSIYFLAGIYLKHHLQKNSNSLSEVTYI